MTEISRHNIGNSHFLLLVRIDASQKLCQTEYTPLVITMGHLSLRVNKRMICWCSWTPKNPWIPNPTFEITINWKAMFVNSLFYQLWFKARRTLFATRNRNKKNELNYKTYNIMNKAWQTIPLKIKRLADNAS